MVAFRSSRREYGLLGGINMSENKTIKVTCEAAALVPLDEMTELQGNLKDLSTENYERLKKSIIDHGVSFPFNLWKTGKTKYIIDAHQRYKVLKRMRDEDGYTVPDLPVAWIKAKDKREAAKKVLAATSQFGTITPDGLHQFMTTFELDMALVKDSYSFNEIDFTKFADAYYAEPKEVTFTVGGKGGSKELNESEFESFEHACPKCGFEFD